MLRLLRTATVQTDKNLSSERFELLEKKRLSYDIMVQIINAYSLIHKNTAKINSRAQTSDKQWDRIPQKIPRSRYYV